MQCAPLGAHSCNHVEFHVNVPLCIRFARWKILCCSYSSARDPYPDISQHHDSCCVGSVRVSDSVAEIPISAASV